MDIDAKPGALHPKRTSFFTYALAALAGLMFGLDVGVISGAIQFIQAEFHISDHMIEWIVSSMMLGAALGALAAGRISSSLGRKRSLLAGGVLFVAGALLSGGAFTPQFLILARLILGLAIGIASFTAPLYLAEVAPKHTRGAIISLYQLMITTGILAAFLSDTALSTCGNWRLMLGILAAPGVLFLIGVFLLPDSPRWLMMRGRVPEAKSVLLHLRGDAAEVEQELTDIAEQLRTPQQGSELLRKSSNFRRSVALGALLQVMQQLTGINVVMYYAPRIFRSLGYETRAQLWFTVAIGLANMLATFIAIFLVDRWGRKPILYSGFTVMAAGLGIAGLMMQLGIRSRGEQLFTVAMLLLFIVGFAMSAGPLIWTLCSEVQPLKGRDLGIAISTFTNWITNLIVGFTFLTLLSRIGPAATFFLYAGFNLLFIGLTFLFVPETKGVTLEEIEHHLMSGKPLRAIGR
jgi:SP family galactose:H+ symporter-like MFS transporter